VPCAGGDTAAGARRPPTRSTPACGRPADRSLCRTGDAALWTHHGRGHSHGAASSCCGDAGLRPEKGADTSSAERRGPPPPTGPRRNSPHEKPPAPSGRHPGTAPGPGTPTWGRQLLLWGRRPPARKRCGRAVRRAAWAATPHRAAAQLPPREATGPIRAAPGYGPGAGAPTWGRQVLLWRRWAPARRRCGLAGRKSWPGKRRAGPVGCEGWSRRAAGQVCGVSGNRCRSLPKRVRAA
jgi:hypothetical protein